MKIGSRIAAATIAAVAWFGLIVQCVDVYQQVASVSAMFWIVLGYFTITTNLLVAVVFSGIALNAKAFRAGWVIAGTMLAILLVGVVYGLLLHGSRELTGRSAVANVVTHMVVPTAVPLFWIFFAEKGTLAWRDPLRWAIYPLAYLIYEMARGSATASYAYPFLNAVTLGWQRTALHAFYIATAFLMCGYAIVWLDRQFASGRPVS